MEFFFQICRYYGKILVIEKNIFIRINALRSKFIKNTEEVKLAKTVLSKLHNKHYNIKIFKKKDADHLKKGGGA